MTKFPDIKRAVVVSAALSFLCLFPFSGLSQGIDSAKDAGVDYQRQKQVTDRFIVPIDSYNGFAGTYGELRGDHFHCGLDMRTGGVQGKKI